MQQLINLQLVWEFPSLVFSDFLFRLKSSQGQWQEYLFVIPEQASALSEQPEKKNYLHILFPSQANAFFIQEEKSTDKLHFNS